MCSRRELLTRATLLAAIPTLIFPTAGLAQGTGGERPATKDFRRPSEKDARQNEASSGPEGIAGGGETPPNSGNDRRRRRGN